MSDNSASIQNEQREGNCIMDAPSLNTPTLLRVEEAANHLRIGRTSMFALIKAGAVKSVQIGRSRRVPMSALMDYAARLTKEQNPAVA